MRRAIALSVVIALAALAACGDEKEEESTEITEVVEDTSSADESTTATEMAADTETATTTEAPDATAGQELAYFASYDLPGFEPKMLRFTPRAGEGWPVVVLLHGGMMDANAMAPVATALAERELLVYAPTYDGYSALKAAGPDQVNSGQWAGETLLGDLSCAVRVARLDAVKQGGDPDRLVLAGYSMGAAFGATVTIVGDDPEITALTSGTCAAPDGSAVPDAFFGWEGPYDWDAVVEAEFAGLLELAPETIRLLGPIPHIEADSSDDRVPFHLRSGDQLYRSVSHAEHLATLEAALAAEGWPVSSEVLPGVSHTDFMGTFIESKGIEEIYDLIAEIANNPTE